MTPQYFIDKLRSDIHDLLPGAADEFVRTKLLTTVANIEATL